jgi:hypothetical protein
MSEVSHGTSLRRVPWDSASGGRDERDTWDNWDTWEQMGQERDMKSKQIAKRKWPKAVWISGEGPYASVAYCPRGITVALYETLPEAERAKQMIDDTGCGGLCVGDHEIVKLA